MVFSLSGYPTKVLNAFPIFYIRATCLTALTILAESRQTNYEASVCLIFFCIATLKQIACDGVRLPSQHRGLGPVALSPDNSDVSQ
jgi:hypothetical protein